MIDIDEERAVELGTKGIINSKESKLFVRYLVSLSSYTVFSLIIFSLKSLREELSQRLAR